MFKNFLPHIAGGLSALLLISNVGWYIAYDLRGDKLVAEQTAHQTTIDNYTLAQEKAKALALEKALEQERKDAQNARKADEAYSDLLGKYNANLLRYQASQRASGRIDLSSTSTTTSGGDSTSESTRISITLTDAGICAENTARLQVVQEWATNK